MTMMHINTPEQEVDIQLHLKQNAPRLPDKELRSFVKQFLVRREEFLNLLTQNPAPLYVLETTVLKERYRQFKSAFEKHLPGIGIYFAVKSNNHPAVAQTLVETGAGLDVSSGNELEMALQTGSHDIVFSGPGKTEAELRLAIENRDRVTLLVDSFGELTKLKRVSSGEEKKIRIGVRLTTNPVGLWRKYGILPEQLSNFIGETKRSSQLDFQGLQFHTSWNLSPTVQVDFIRSLGTVLKALTPAQRDLIRFVDIGGGFWPPQGEWLQPAGTKAGKLRVELGFKPGSSRDHYRLPAESIEIFAREISRAINEHIHSVISCRICAEPGRWLCNDAMHLLLSVVDRKNDDLVITDAGTNAVGWERFESDYFPVINLTRPALEEKVCLVLGSLCTPHDVWGYSYWGENIREGDILMIPTQGAYTYSLRQNFIKSLPEVVQI